MIPSTHPTKKIDQMDSDNLTELDTATVVP